MCGSLRLHLCAVRPTSCRFLIMDSFLNTQGSLGSSMSCSDTSYSSENSVTSSRDTSPDLPHDLLSKLNLSRPNHSNHVTSVTEMERSLFHIGSEQADRANANTEGDDRITTLGRSFRTSSTVASAGISLSTNWRDHAASSNSFGLAIDSPTGEISTLPSPQLPQASTDSPVLGPQNQSIC